MMSLRRLLLVPATEYRNFLMCRNYSSGCYVDPKVKKMKKRQEHYQNEAIKCPVWLREGHRDRMLYSVTFFSACFGLVFALVFYLSSIYPRPPPKEED